MRVQVSRYRSLYLRRCLRCDRAFHTSHRTKFICDRVVNKGGVLTCTDFLRQGVEVDAGYPEMKEIRRARKPADAMRRHPILYGSALRRSGMSWQEEFELTVEELG